MNIIASRMAHIQPFKVMEVQRRAHELERAGHAVVHMEIGQPDFGAPPAVVAAAKRAVDERTLGYTDALGLPELRAALADFYRSHLGAEVPAERIVATAGASGALLLALGAAANPGDEILMADPGYPCYSNFVLLLGAVPVRMPVDAAQAWQPTLEDVRRHWSQRTRGIILASPSNPAGTLIEPAALDEIAGWVRAQGGFVVLDEIYQGLVYGERPASRLAGREGVFIINSFSKYFCMTGWRLGWAVVPEALHGAVEKLAQNLFICPSAPAQYAALAAFGPDNLTVLEARREEYRRRRDWLVPRLIELGFDIPAVPEGAFYIYAGCGRFGADSAAFAANVLDQALVAITPGADFGAHRAETHVRFAYTRAMPELEEGVARLEKYLRR